MSFPLRSATLQTLDLTSAAASIEHAASAPPLFLGDEKNELERRRAAINAALDGLDARVGAAIQDNRGLLQSRLLILGSLAVVIVGVTIYAVIREAVVAGGVAGVGTLTTAIWFLPQYRSIERERIYLIALVPTWRVKVAAATNDEELKRHANDIVAEMRRLDGGH